jgi:hypothetical protein
MTVLVCVVLTGLFGVMGRVDEMALGDMGVVSGLFVASRIVMLRGCTMVAGGVFVVLGGFAVVFGALLRHGR